MAFDVNAITVQGAIAIASATAGNKLVIDGCDAVTSIYTQAQAVQIASRPATPDSTTTSIALAGSTENHVYAYASFIQGETGQPGGDVHSFLLYGHSENTPNVVVVVAVASSTDPVHLPEPGDVTNRTEVQFELSFSATDEVVTVAGTSMYTTRGEFLLLKNRTVTTHAEGETTIGDDQTIYGDKTFKGNATFSTIDGEEVEMSGISVHAIRPATDGTILLGTPDSRFLSVATPVVLFGSNSTTGYGANCFGNAGTYDSQAGLKSGNLSNEAYIGCFSTSEPQGSTQGVNETTHKAVMRCKPTSGNSTHCNITLTYNETADSSSVDVNAGSTAINGNVSVAGDVSAVHLSASGDITTAQSYVCSGQGRLRASGTLWCEAKESGNTEATLCLDASTPNEPELFIDLTAENGDRMAGLWLTKDCELYLESDSGTTKIGKASAPIDYVTAYNFTAKDQVSIYSQNANDTTAAWLNLRSNLTDVPQIDAQLENSSGDVLAYVSIYADDAQQKCFLSMSSDNYEKCIGTPARKIDHIYALDLQGIIPHPTEPDEDPPVGSIVMINVMDQHATSISVGDTLQAVSGGRQIAFAVWDSSNNKYSNGNYISTTPVFRALSGGVSVLVGSAYYINTILAIRVQ